jgi:hypothetical protein
MTARTHREHRSQLCFHWLRGVAWRIPLLRHCLLFHNLVADGFYDWTTPAFSGRATILSRVPGSVTNNNGFWIGWLDLLALRFQLQRIIRAHNQELPKSRSIPYWTTSAFSSHCDWLGSDLRIGHFFSFRCGLVNTPQLNTELSCK